MKPFPQGFAKSITPASGYKVLLVSRLKESNWKEFAHLQLGVTVLLLVVLSPTSTKAGSPSPVFLTGLAWHREKRATTEEKVEMAVGSLIASVV